MFGDEMVWGRGDQFPNIFSAYRSFVFSRSCFETLISVNMAFITNVDDFQAALNACVSVQDWEMLTESVLIPDEWMPMAYQCLVELTVDGIEFEVSSALPK